MTVEGPRYATKDCVRCDGSGELDVPDIDDDGRTIYLRVTCTSCLGVGVPTACRTPRARSIDDHKGAAMGGGKDPRREARPLVVARTHADAVRYVQKEMGKRIHEVVVVATTAPSPALLRHRIAEDDVHWVPGWDQAPKAAMVEAEIHHLIRSRPWARGGGHQ